MEDKIINEEQNESLIQADSSREVKEEAKKNFFQILLGYLKGILWDFVQSFKYNNMKLAGLLIIIPGAIFGFFLYYHALVVRQVVFISTLGSNYYGTPDISGLLLFIMMLFGILNIFTGFGLMSKKNLGSLIVVVFTSVIMVVSGIIYIILVKNYFQGVNSYFDALGKNVADIMEKTGLSEEEATRMARQLAQDGTSQYFIYGIPVSSRTSFSQEFVVSVGSVILCMVCAVAGVVLGFINYDRTWEKADR
jgi:hypothetical protein